MAQVNCQRSELAELAAAPMAGESCRLPVCGELRWLPAIVRVRISAELLTDTVLASRRTGESALTGMGSIAAKRRPASFSCTPPAFENLMAASADAKHKKRVKG